MRASAKWLGCIWYQHKGVGVWGGGVHVNDLLAISVCALLLLVVSQTEGRSSL